MSSNPRSLVSRLAAAIAVAALCASGAAQDPRPVPVRWDALDAGLRDAVDDPLSPPRSVFLILRDQPAVDVAEVLRPVYAARVDSAWAPTRAALRRIAPLLPSRAERAAMSVGRQIALEDALLRPEEREARREARSEVARLLAEMRAAVLARAWALCAPAQERIAAHVMDLPDARVLARTCALNALVASVRPADLPTLLRDHPEIVRVAEAGVRTSRMDVSAPLTGADDWTSNGVDGSGQRVAVVDTGIDGAHPALEDSDDDSMVVAAAVYLSEAANQSNFDDDDEETDDLHGHGTHIAGTIASQDATYGGVAPGAPLMNAKCFYRTSSGGGSGLDADIVDATDWALTNGASVLSLSFGGAGDTDGSQALTRFYDAVVHVTGASVAVAAGNSGPGTNTVESPGDGFNVLTVGAFDDEGSASTSDDTIAGFSGRGPTDDGRLKPDLVAPGVSIRSTSHAWEGSGADFVNKSGTSMATPHVAAGMALLLDHESDWQPEALKALLLNSCRNASPVPTAPGQVWGHGALDLGRAYSERDRVETATLTSGGTDTLYFALTDVAVGDRATLAWNRVVAYASGGRADGAGAATSLVDLDLALYGPDGLVDDASESEDDPVEQVRAPAALDDGVLVVERVGSFPSGQTSLDLALASAAAVDAVLPPSLAVTVSAPSIVAGGAQLTVTATVANSGGLAAVAPQATLTLPTGWTLASGSAARTLSDVAPDGTAQAVWTVDAPSTTGDGTFTIGVRSTCWGTTFQAAAVTTTVRADATPPTVSAGADVSLFAHSAAGRTVPLVGSGDDDSGGVVTFEWDTDGDGAFDDPDGSVAGERPLVDLAIGEHTIGLRGTDPVGNTATDTKVVRILDNPPDASAGADAQVFEGDGVELDGSESHDIEGDLAFAWAFGDGATAAGASVVHAYADQGTYTVTLTVTDGAGQSAEDSLVVTVANADPVADAGPDRVVGEGRTLTLLGSGSDPGASDALTFAWSFGDGGSAATADAVHVYRDDGVYTATLTVTDDDGATATDSVRVEVRNLPPEVDAGLPLVIDEGDTVVLSGTATDEGPDDVLTFEWNVDGVRFPGTEIVHTYERDGNRRAYLTVTDDDGGATTDSVFVEVRNVPPTVALPAEVTVGIGGRLSLDLEPWDPSPVDRASLRVGWRIVAPSEQDGGDGTVIASGGDTVVVWDADRRLRGALLEVSAADDDVQVVRTALLHATTPPIAAALAPVLAAGLDAPSEKKVLAALFTAHDKASPRAKRGALRKALGAVRRARKRLADATGDGLLAALTAIEEDLAVGIAPPVPSAPDVSGDEPGTDVLLAALPGAGFEAGPARRLTKALLRLRDAERRGKSVKALTKLRAKAAKAAGKLPGGAVTDWFVAALTD